MAWVRCMRRERMNGLNRAELGPHGAQEVVEDGQRESTSYGKSETATDR